MFKCHVDCYKYRDSTVAIRDYLRLRFRTFPKARPATVRHAGIFGFEPEKTTIAIKSHLWRGGGSAGGNSETSAPVKNDVTRNRVMVNTIISPSA